MRWINLNKKLLEKIIIFLAFSLTIITIAPITTQIFHLNSQFITEHLTCKPVINENEDAIIILNESKDTESFNEVSKNPISKSTISRSDESKIIETKKTESVVIKSVSNEPLKEESFKEESIIEESKDIPRYTQGISEEFYCYTSFSYKERIHYVILEEGLQQYLFQKSEEYNVDYELILAIIGCESGWNVDVGKVGSCVGLGMISSAALPSLNSVIGTTDLSDPMQNIEAICYMMYYKINTNDNNVTAALMSYNKGQAGAEGCFSQGIYETDYTRKVLGFQSALKTAKQADKQTIK